jgi:hypothetical protein
MFSFALLTLVSYDFGFCLQISYIIMASALCVMSRILGLFSMVLSLFTFVRLTVFLSSQSPASDHDHELPCCGWFIWPLLFNMVLLNLFIVLHTMMASSGWKKMVQYAGFSAIFQRQIYVITSCLCLNLLIWFITPMPGPALWHFDILSHPTQWTTVMIVHGTMWFVVFLCAVMNYPLELVGLSNPAASLGQSNTQKTHAGLVAFLLILWVQMTMTVERFLLALTFTLYILFESRVHGFVK